MLVSDSDRVGPWTKGYLRTTTTGVVRSITGRGCCPVGDADVEMEYWRVSSLVPGYMTVSWTVSPPAVGVRVTGGVEGRPEGGRKNRLTSVYLLH